MTKLEQYKSMLLGLYQPGAVTREPGTVHADCVEADAEFVVAADDLYDQLEAELFPHTADQCLEEWETLLGVVTTPGQSKADRRQVLIGRWRGAMSSSPGDLRAQLAGALNPEYAFRDVHDDDDVSFRYRTVVGGGSIAEAATAMRIASEFAVDGRWNTAQKLQTLVLLELVDKDDDIYLEGKVSSYAAGGSGCASGLVLYDDDNNAYLFGPWNDAGTVRVRAGRIEDNVIASPQFFGSSASMPFTPFWLRAYRVSGTWRFEYGSTLTAPGTMTYVGTHRGTIQPKEVGWFSMNEGSSYGYSDVAQTQKRYGKSENNVELIEMPLSVVPTAEPEAKFVAFVHRDPADTGLYDLDQAQRIADRGKQGHTLILVGESDCFRWDDPESLFDRDVFGS